MEKNRSKVLMSILIVALCLSVCIGLTYAYFTDTASSKGNKIQAGSLKLDLQLYDQIGGWHSIKDSQDPVFNYDKWEPGYVDAKLLRVVNLGNLALKWEAKLVSTEAVSQYANVIEVYVQTSNSEMPYPASRAEALAWTHVGSLDDFINTTQQIANGIFTAQGESAYISIALYMPAEIEDNNLQGQVLGEFDIQINATQYTHEEDAFGPDYDPNARFPEGGVTPPDDTEDTTEPTETESDDTDEPVEPTDPELFTWAPNADGNSYTVTGLKAGVTPPEELVIPSTYNGLPVTAVGDSAFQSNTTITSVTIPNGVTTIGTSAFSACSNLQNVTVPDSITYVGTGAFNSCNSLVYNEHDNAYYLGNDVNECVVLMMAKDTSAETYIVNENTKIIYNSAFSGCSNLTSIDIPNSVITVGDSAFKNCSNLQRVIIGDNVTTIGDESFAWCSSLTSLEIPDSVTVIGSCAFMVSGLTYISLSDNLTTIGGGAFAHTSIRAILIPASVTTIGEHAFSDCGMGSCTIYCRANEAPEGWEFGWNCGNPECGGECEKYPNSTVWGWTGDPADLIFNFNQNGTSYTITGLKYDGSMILLTDMVIPSTYNDSPVTAIGSFAFSQNSDIKHVTIPSSVTTIGDFAFEGCSGLTSITFEGTMAQWNAINFGLDWNIGSLAAEILCSDGTVALN